MVSGLHLGLIISVALALAVVALATRIDSDPPDLDALTNRAGSNRNGAALGL